MPHPDPATRNAALAPAPALFDVTEVAQRTVDGVLERVALEDLELAPNPRRQLSQESITSLSAVLIRTGQLIPCIGRRPGPDRARVVLFDGQRRLLAARASRELAGTVGLAGLAPVRSLIVLLLDHDPSPDEIRRVQAQANQRKELALADQQRQFARLLAGARRPRRRRPDHRRLRRPRDQPQARAQPAPPAQPPEAIRERVAERPAGSQLSVTMANRLADMHQLAPRLTDAVAARVTSGDLHDKALRDLGAFVHRTVVEDEHVYAVRIDDGALLDAAEHVEQARAQLSETGRGQAARLLGCEHAKLEAELDALTARARNRALKLRITPAIRDRARAGRFAFVHDRGADFAAGIWVVDPTFTLDLTVDALNHDEDDPAPAREEAFFAGAALTDDELQQAAHDDRARKQQAKLRHAEATTRNLGLGHDLHTTCARA